MQEEILANNSLLNKKHGLPTKLSNFATHWVWDKCEVTVFFFFSLTFREKTILEQHLLAFPLKLPPDVNCCSFSEEQI